MSAAHPGDLSVITEEDPLDRAGSHPKHGEQQLAKRERKDRCSKKVYVAFLPERYEPLIEEDEILSSEKQEKKRKKKEKYKKCRKNVGKALRYSWKCLVLGLQSFSTSFSTPLSAATVLMTDNHKTRT